jgi:hypothetical protein
MSSSPTTDSREELAAAALPADVVSESEPPIRRRLPDSADADVVFLPPPHQPPLEAVLEPPVVGAEVVEPVVAERVPQSWPIYLWWVLCKTLEWLFGLASVVGCLAVLSAVPLVQFVSLGYLLEASARVARSGKLRHGFIDMPKFARIGSMVFGTWIMLLPLRFLSALAQDAYLVDPTGTSARIWRVGQLICTALMLGHILLAWYSGGKLRHFFWPFLAPFQIGAKLVFGTIIGPIVRPLVEAISPRLASDLYIERPLSSWFPPAILLAGIMKGKMYRRTRDAVWDFVASLRLPQYFWLGVRGFVGALTWIAIPALLMMGGTTLPNGGLAFVSGWLGAFLLGIVLIYLPFAQTHMAVQNRFVEIFNLGEVRRQFSRAPIAWWLALTITLLFAVPLYLLTIEATQREVTYLINLFFVAFIYPARLVLGWAMGRALHYDKPRFILIGLVARFAAIPVVLGYLIILWASQYTAWFGPFSLMVQHAFMVPVPFIGV